MFTNIHEMINTSYGATLSVLAVAWALLGLAGFIYSLVCATKTPSVGKILFGILLAIVTGPLYWIYWYVDKDYCRGKSHISL